MKIININLSKILPPSFDSRSKETPEDDAELLESIKQFGILEPILVKPHGKDFEIIFGHRRYLCAGRAGLPTVPAIIFSAGDKETEILKIHENLHRLPNSHVDQGRTFKYLRETFNMSESEIAALVKKSIAYVSQHLTFLETDSDIVDAVHIDHISFSSGRELANIKNPVDRKRFFNIIKDSGATIDVLHNWAQQSNRSTSPCDSSPVYVPDDPVPPYSSDPTFPCQSCDRITPIGQLKIIRLCPDCDFSFKKAILEIHQQEVSKN